MNIYNHPDYKKFEETVSESVKNKANLAIFGLPGMGSTFFIKKFLEKNGDKNVSYITMENEGLTDYNFIDLDFYKNKKALEIANEYFRKASASQNFAVVINTPYIIDTQEYRNSFLAGHIYREFFFNPVDNSRAMIMADNLNVKISNDEISGLIEVTGGISGLVKFLLLNPEKNILSINDLIQDKSFLHIFLPITEVASKCSEDVLSKLSVVKNDEFVGKVLKEYFIANPMKARINIVIQPDLTFYEDGVKNENILLKLEKVILEYLVDNQGVITKEKISDLKWGDGSYDEYSDQAIFKTIARLKKKLNKHTLISIPGYGYKLN